MRQLWKNCQGTTKIFQEVHIRAKRWPWHWNQLSSPQCPTTLPFACMQVAWIPLWYQQNQISESAAFPQQFALRFRQIHLMLPTWWWKRWRKHCKMVFSVRCFNNLRFFSSRWICWWKGSIQEAGTKRKLQSLHWFQVYALTCTFSYLLTPLYTYQTEARQMSIASTGVVFCWIIALFNLCIESSLKPRRFIVAKVRKSAETDGWVGRFFTSTLILTIKMSTAIPLYTYRIGIWFQQLGSACPTSHHHWTARGCITRSSSF